MSTTSSLHLKLEGLFLSFEFVDVFSGQLLVEETILYDPIHNGNPIFDVKDISTTEELQGPRQNNTNTLVFQLRRALNSLICITIQLHNP